MLSRRFRIRVALPALILATLMTTAVCAPAADARLGPVRIALLRATYSDVGAPRYSIEQLQQAASEMHTFFGQLSYGRLDIQFQVADAPGLGPYARTASGHDLASDAMESAATRGFDFRGYEAVMVLTAVPSGADCPADFTGDIVRVSTDHVPAIDVRAVHLVDCRGTAGLTPTASDVEWGPWAHEMGHVIQGLDPSGMDLIHPAGYNDGNNLMDSCYPCGEGIFGLSKPPINTSGQTVFGDFLPAPKVVTIATPTTGDGDTSRTLVLSPLGDQAALMFANPMGIKIETPGSSSLFGPGGPHYYTVEARRRIGQDNYGTGIPRLPSEGVHIHAVDDRRSPPVTGIFACDTTEAAGCVRNMTDPRASSCRGAGSPDNPRYCYPFELWQPGEVYTDVLNGVQIRVDGTAGNGYVVTVDRHFPLPRPDLYMTPWRSPPMNTWETPDIWIDSSCNGYELARPSNPLRYGRRADGSVIGNGDDLCPDHPNRLYATVRNGGNATANNVTVHFKTAYPLLATSRGPYAEVGVAHIRSLAPGASATVFVPWTPVGRFRPYAPGPGAAGIEVKVDAVEGENLTTNQDVFENVVHLDVPNDQPRIQRPFYLDLQSYLIRVPGPDPHHFEFEVRSLAGDPNAVLTVGDQNSLDASKGASRASMILSSPKALPVGTLRFDVGVRALTELVDAAIPAKPIPDKTGYAYEPPRTHSENTLLGGIAFFVNALRPTSLRLTASRGARGRIAVAGRLRPGKRVVLAIELRRGGRLRTALVRTNRGGRFHATIKRPGSGKWRVDALWQGDRRNMSALSPTVLPR